MFRLRNKKIIFLVHTLNLRPGTRIYMNLLPLVGVTIVAKYDYCNSIDIAGSTIAILLLLLTTVAILLSETFMLV